MASEWAEEADRQARAITRDLIEVGRKKGFPRRVPEEGG
jgi:hypothetical protein